MKSKQVKVLSVLLLILGTSWFYFKHRRASHTLHPFSTLKRNGQSATLDSTRMRSSFANEQLGPAVPHMALAATTERNSEASPTMEQICEEDWRQLAETSAQAATQELLQGQGLLSKSCFDAMLKQVQNSSIKLFLERCVTPGMTEEAPLFSETQAEMCRQGLIQFRSYVIYELSEKNLIPSEQPDSVLINYVAGAMSQLGDLSLVELDFTLQMTEELTNRLPNLYEAYKARLLALVARELKTGQVTEENEFYETYEELLSFVPPDVELSQLAERDLVHLPFLRLSAQNRYPELEQMAQAFQEDYPNSYVGYFYMARALWQQGAREEAQEWMKRAMSLDSQENLSQYLLNPGLPEDPRTRIFHMRVDLPLYELLP